jgi:hypothetical protein
MRRIKMTDIGKIRREVQDVFTEEHRYVVGMAVSYLHSRGYLGGVPDGMFKIGDLVEVSPNNEYYQDWKGTVLEITGIYRQRSIGYQTENTRPPIRYSVKDLKDSWTYGYTDDFSFDDLITAAPKGETK